jgi:hypothetical protein
VGLEGGGDQQLVLYFPGLSDFMLKLRHLFEEVNAKSTPIKSVNWQFLLNWSLINQCQVKSLFKVNWKSSRPFQGFFYFQKKGTKITILTGECRRESGNKGIVSSDQKCMKVISIKGLS